VALVWSTFLAEPAVAERLLSDEYVRVSREALNHVYRIEYNQAIAAYGALAKRFPDHPGPHLAGAVAHWLQELYVRQDFELDHFISPSHFTQATDRQMPEEERQAFFQGIENCRQRAEAYLKRHPGDKDGRYYLGALEGALGVFAFTIERSYMKALKHGKKSYKYQRAIIDEDPDFYDSYLTTGTYEYVLSNLPWYIKWIASIAGLRGNEERGFEHLILAAKKSRFVTYEARVLLMVLYVREKQYEYSLQMAQQMHRSFPENFLFHLNQAQIFEAMGDHERASEVYLDVLRSAEELKRNYQLLPIGSFRFSVAERFRSQGKIQQALELYERAAGDPRTLKRERVLSHLRAGEMLDLLGKREEAVAQYREVQKFQDIEGAHKRASRFLKKPYRRE
jgi:tetratricopeptide (TPR) repeat protein